MQTTVASPITKPVYTILLGLICLGIVVNCFLLLSHAELEDWDEARHGVSAYEMVQSGNFLINTYDYKLDYWNAKPPLSFWTVALGYKLFGYNLLGLRFFSATLSCLTLFGLLIFCYKKISPSVTIATGLVLISLYRFFGRHNARTADPDALFIFFYIAGLLLVLAWPKRHAAYWAASFLAGLTFLTKSFHAVPMVLLLVIFFLMDFRISRKSLKQAMLCLLIALAPLAIWVVARFKVDGSLFFEQMIFYDLLERATNTIEGHVGGPMYYLEFTVTNYKIWFYTLVFAICVIFALRIKASCELGFVAMLLHPEKTVVAKLVLAATVPLFLYSMSASKLYWYIYPAFPFIAILLGVFLDAVYTLMQRQNKMLARIFLLYILAIGVTGEVNSLKWLYRHSITQNPVHVAMAELGLTLGNHNAALFLDVGDWRPADALAARLYGNFQLMRGGASGYNSVAGQEKAFLLSRSEKAHAVQN